MVRKTGGTDSLRTHYGLLLGLNKSWEVTNVVLNQDAGSVTITVEFADLSGVCALCGAKCELLDRLHEQRWRHADTMEFETILVARIPRVNCIKCSVKVVDVSWNDTHARFTPIQ